MMITKSRNSREGLYMGFRVIRLRDRHQRTGPVVYPPAEALRYKNVESTEEVYARCSHIVDCPHCHGKGRYFGGGGLYPEETFCETCDGEGKVWK
jgi:hypothetical protein